MGEEKPEEELMGKRKSSPRLSATRNIHVAIFSMTIEDCSIHQIVKRSLDLLVFLIFYVRMGKDKNKR